MTPHFCQGIWTLWWQNYGIQNSAICLFKSLFVFWCVNAANEKKCLTTSLYQTADRSCCQATEKVVCSLFVFLEVLEYSRFPFVMILFLAWAFFVVCISIKVINCHNYGVCTVMQSVQKVCKPYFQKAGKKPCIGILNVVF